VSPRWMASDDEGRRFVGHEAIRRWSDREFIVARDTQTFTQELMRRGGTRR
jgi:hypothetical protein